MAFVKAGTEVSEVGVVVSIAIINGVFLGLSKNEVYGCGAVAAK